jgi:hypothetical protein
VTGSVAAQHDRAHCATRSGINLFHRRCAAFNLLRSRKLWPASRGARAQLAWLRRVHNLVEPVGHDLGSDVRVEDPDRVHELGPGHRPSTGFEDLAVESAAVVGEIGGDGSALLEWHVLHTNSMVPGAVSHRSAQHPGSGRRGDRVDLDPDQFALDGQAALRPETAALAAPPRGRARIRWSWGSTGPARGARHRRRSSR